MSPDDPSSPAVVNAASKDAELSHDPHTPSPPSESPPTVSDEDAHSEAGLKRAPDEPEPEPEPELEREPEPEPEPEPDPAAIAAEGEKMKEQGNDSFKRGRYGEAIDLYSKAIGASRLHAHS
jgi:hypothetical protein